MTDIATWSQLISSMAVLGTLIYLAIETRQNAAAERAATRLGVQNASITELHKVCDYPDIFLCMEKPEALTPGEAVRLNAWLAAVLRHMEYTWLQHKENVVEDDLWATERQVLRIVFNTARGRTWWQSVGRYSFGASFGEEVEAQMKDQPSTTILSRILAWGSEGLRT